MGKATEAFSRAAKIEDTTIGWRFVNPLMKAQYGVDSMPETRGERRAADFNVCRADQDAFALRSQQRAAAAIAAGRPGRGDRPGHDPAEEGRSGRRSSDGRASARNDARIAGEAQGRRPAGWHGHGGQRIRRQRRRMRDDPRVRESAGDGIGLTPRARRRRSAVAGVAPRIMGFGPAPAMRKVLATGEARARRRWTSSSSTRRSPRRRSP